MSTAYPVGDITQAVSRLDQDIVEAERLVVEAQRRLDELRTMRDGITPFIQQYVAPKLSVSSEIPNAPATVQRRTLTARVVDVFLSDPDAVLDLNDVVDRIAATGADEKPSSIRNAVYYAARSHKLRQHGNGQFTLRNASTPVTAGVEESGQPSNGSPEEKGATP